MSNRSQADTAEFQPPPAAAEFSRPQLHSSLVRVDLAGLSHPGKVRPSNEDHFLLLRSERALQRLGTNLPDGLVPERFEETGYCLVVADGMGGRAAGDVASSLALTVGANLVLNAPSWTMRITDAVAQDLMDRIQLRMRQLDAVVSASAQADPALRGMGTTLTGAYSLG